MACNPQANDLSLPGNPQFHDKQIRAQLLCQLIEPNLSSPSSSRRLFCLELLVELEKSEVQNFQGQSEAISESAAKPVSSSAFQTALYAERTPATIHDYRERGRLFENLIKAVINQDSYAIQEHVVKYLIGSIYVNFEKLWGVTIRTISAIIQASKWPQKLIRTILENLTTTDDLIYSSEKELIAIDDSLLSYVPEAIASILLNEKETYIADRPDHVLHRHLLYQILVNFSNVIECDRGLHKQYVDLFLDFAHKNVLVSPFIETHSTQNLLEEVQLEHDKQKNPKDGKVAEKIEPKSKYDIGHSTDKRRIRDTFTTAIKVLKEFKSLKEAHNAPKIKELTLDLLCSRDNTMQRVAFECLLSYDDEILQLYSSRIFKLMDDKTVRTEFALFSIDNEQNQEKNSYNLQQSHRSQVMDIILRVLFGKMLGRIGKRVAGKDKSEQRKKLIMRFIAGCKTEEVITFLNRILGPLSKYVKLPYDQLKVEISIENLNLSEYVPLYKLHAILMSLNSYMQEIATSNSEIQPYVMKTLIAINMLVSEPFRQRIRNEKILDVLRDLRRRCLAAVIKFFKLFECYNFQEVEIDLLFQHLIWECSQDFSNRNRSSPTPIFQFITVLSSNQRFYPLLIKKDKSSGQTLIKCVIDLYKVDNNLSIDRKVLKFTATILANLLRGGDRDPTLSEEENIELVNDEAATQPEDSIEVGPRTIQTYRQDDFLLDKLINVHLGIEMLLGHVDEILERLQNVCRNFVESKKNEYRVESEELEILAQLGSVIKDSNQSMICSKLLLLTLQHQKNEALKIKTIETIQQLVRYIGEITDTTFFELLADLLGHNRKMAHRKELCKIVMAASISNSFLQKASESLALINECDLDEQPDLVKWNEGFHIMFSFIEESISGNERVKEIFITLLFFVNQVCFLINNIDQYEFSIRDNCVVFFEKLSTKLECLSRAHFESLINETVLKKFIKKGLRSTNEAVKNLYCYVLRSIAMNSINGGVPWDEFRLFCDKNQELDFWINIKHIQLHSRSRALARLGANPDLDKISPKTLSSYFLPVATGFLFSKNYKSLGSLSENSIKLISRICKRLNWTTYESILDYYLTMLTKANYQYQSTNIKLVTEIIKSFHFDISSCQEATENIQEDLKLRERMRKRRKESNEVIFADVPTGKRLNPSTARLVYNSIIKKLIPKLSNCLHDATHVEFEHDKNMRDYKPEKNEIKRIPIAFAIVLLLNLLPDRHIQIRDNLPTLLMKLSTFLKSKSELVRKSARATLIKIMSYIGPTYLPDLIRELKQNLDKGFQIHVLNYTIHAILSKMPLKYGDLDYSSHELIESCSKEIFGRIAEDKEIAQILAKTSEAKKTSSYDTLLILASCISSNKLSALNDFLRNQLKTAADTKTVNKLAICTQKIFFGLAKNTKFPCDRLIDYIETSIKESLPNLKVPQKIEQASASNSKGNNRVNLRSDRYIIEKDLPRDRVKSKINEKGNFHMIVENSLNLLLKTFQKNKELFNRDQSLKRKLNGFVGLLSTCLKSANPKCVMRSLRCIYFIAQTKSDLPNFKAKSRSLTKRIFIILNMYNGVGMARGDNLEMIMMCFKTLTLLLTRCEHIELNESQLTALLTYIEQDLNDETRQPTAFRALRSILKRKLATPELATIMKKIADFVVTAEDDKVRKLSLLNWEIYLLEYPHKSSTLQNYLKLFMRQLDYEFVDGRLSLLEFIDIIISKFPSNLFQEHQELLFNLLSQRLVNEEADNVELILKRSIMRLMKRLSSFEQNRIFNRFVLRWATIDDFGLQLLSAKLMSIFIDVSEELISSDRNKISKILAVIKSGLNCKRCTDDQLASSEEKTLNGNLHMEENEEENSDDVKCIIPIEDKLVVQLLSLFKQIIDKRLVDCLDVRFMEDLKPIWQNISTERLTHKFLPIVLLSCDLYKLFILKSNLESAVNTTDSSPDDYLGWNAHRIVRILSDKCIELLDRAEESKELQNQLIKILILLGRIIAQSSNTIDIENYYLSKLDDADALNHLLSLPELPGDGFDSEKLSRKITKKRTDLMWLATKIVMQAKKEAALQRLTRFHRRIFVLRWTAAIANEIGPKRLEIYAILFLMTPARELSDQQGKTKADMDSPKYSMLTMSEDLLKFIKNSLGVERFNKVYSQVQLHYTKKRVDRKKKLAIAKVTDQARGVRHKLKQHSKKRKAKAEARKTKRKKLDL